MSCSNIKNFTTLKLRFPSEKHETHRYCRIGDPHFHLENPTYQFNIVKIDGKYDLSELTREELEYCLNEVLTKKDV